MGLYDIVHCKKPLPDGWRAVELQTKDLGDPYMEHYTIEEDGRLFKEPVWYDNGTGNIRRDTNYHGWLRMIGVEMIGREPPNPPGWPDGRPIYKSHEYAAKFTDGVLVEIKCEDS